MHNPTRRTKRTRRPFPLTRPLIQLSQNPDTRFNVDSSDESPTTSANYGRHRPGRPPPDALRGAMLVAIIVVTIVLYFVLWELERSSFAPVAKLNLTRSAMATSPSEAASPRYPPPVVHRQGEPVRAPGGSNLTDDHISALSNKPGRTTSNAWPPPVNHVPEELRPDDLAGDVDDRHEDEIKKLPSFDSAYCNGPCRFLLPVRIGEQESKARVHFMQLRMLAQRLNRTIVLPNVGMSRMSACSEWPFGAYYDTHGFVHRNGSSASRLAIGPEEFATWVDERPALPNTIIVSMESVRQDDQDAPGPQSNSQDILVEKTAVNPKIASCLESKLARLRSSLPTAALSIFVDSGALKTESDVSSRLVHLLLNNLDFDADSEFDMMMEPGYEYAPQYTNSSYLSLADVDVLILDYDLRHPLFPASAQTNFNLHYAPVLYDLADRLSENLGPFIGVHWRMENVPVQNLAWCAASLVSALHGRLQDDVAGEGVQHVWLATDHPRPASAFSNGVRVPAAKDQVLSGVGSGMDGTPLRNDGPLRKSSTFKALSLEHDDAIGILHEAFQPGGELEAWTLTDLAEQLRRYTYVEGRLELNDTWLHDSGVFGILDKLVIVQAKVFISGSKECSKTSSFSKQVIEARQETSEAERGKGTIRNVVEYFGQW